ncbi:MAG: hypothetical protein L3J13_03655 [Devosiaceae bacterium]|nr:hypothetical protein [Devosiaceae bacterium]
MTNTIKKVAAAVIAMASFSSATSAMELDIQGGGQVKPRVTSIQLGVTSPADYSCPGQAKITVWVFSNKPSTFPILLVSNNGVVLGPYQVETVKNGNGPVIGTWSQDVLVGTSIDTAYHIVTPNSDISSLWVPLSVTC